MTTRRTPLSIVCAFLIATVLPAQQPTNPTLSAAPTPVQIGIENRMWRIAKVQGCAVEGEQADSEGLIDEKGRAFILLMNGRVSGTESYRGTYKLSGDDLTLGGDPENSAGTLTGPELNEPYTATNCKGPFDRELRIEQRGDQILLRDKHGQAQLLLVPYAVGEPATPKPEPSAQQPAHPIPSSAPIPAQTVIENRQWRITKYRGDGSGQTNTEDLIDTKNNAWISFSNGHVGGSPGCGGWNGSYQLTAGELAFQAKWWVMGFCSEEDINNNSLVEKAFLAGSRIEPGDNEILLRDKNGNAQILLAPYIVGEPVSMKPLTDTIMKIKGELRSVERMNDAHYLSDLTLSMRPDDIDDKTMADLISLLDIPDDSVRLWAATSLGNLGSRAKAAIPELLKLLPESDCLIGAVTSAVSIRTALKKMGVTPLPRSLTCHTSGVGM